jgi:hypothetical protein
MCILPTYVDVYLDKSAYGLYLFILATQKVHQHTITYNAPVLLVQELCILQPTYADIYLDKCAGSQVVG